MLDRKKVHLLLMASIVWAGTPLSAQEDRSVEQRLSALEEQNHEQKKLLDKALGGDALRVYWKDGVRFESSDKRYKLRIGGRIHYDVAFFDPDSDTQAAVESTTGTTKVRIEDGSEFRRARIELGGEVGDRVEWVSAYDFAGGRATFRDVYVGLKDLPVGNLRAGQFREPFGFEQLSSSNNIPFIERSLRASQDPARNAGFMLFDAPLEERMTWAVGAFRPGTDDGEISKGDGEWAATGRVTGLPFHDEAGDDWVHLGVAYSHRSPTDDRVSFSAKPEANLAPAYIAVSNLPAETMDVLGAEAAWVRGPFTLMGEYSQTSIDAPSGATAEPTFNGYYALASYILTGEHRPYRKASGVFDGIKPTENAFGTEGGRGAWEVLVRVSSLDLSDDSVDSGELDDWTLGLNWYLNPNTRLMANYIVSELDPAGGLSQGTTNTILFRVQFAF